MHTPLVPPRTSYRALVALLMLAGGAAGFYVGLRLRAHATPAAPGAAPGGDEQGLFAKAGLGPQLPSAFAAPSDWSVSAGRVPPGDAGVAAVTLRGEVRTGGRGVAGVRVLVSGGSQEVLSDGEGRFAVAGLAPGRYALRAVGDGVSAYRDAIAVPPGDGDKKTGSVCALGAIDLVAAPELRGRIVETGGHPVENVEVTLGEGLFAPLPRRVRSEAGGLFHLPGVLPGRYLLSVTAPGFVSVSLPLRAPVAGPELSIRLARAARLVGEAVDEAGHPVVGARVSVARDDGYTTPSAPTSSPTPPRGLPLVEPLGELGVVRGPIPYPPIDRDPESPVSGPSPIPAQAAVAARDLAARPDPAARPLAPTAATASGLLTDATGHFHADEVAAGRVVVIVSHPAFAEGRSQAIVLAPGAATAVRIILRKALSLRGRVTDGKGGLLTGAELWVAGVLGAISDARGRFELHGLPGPVEVEVRMRGYTPVRRRVDPKAEPDVDLAVSGAGERLTGVVMDDRGRTIVNAKIFIESGTALGPKVETATDRNGEFVVTGTLPRPIKVTATHGEHLKSTVADVMPGDDLRITLSSGGAVDGELRDERGGFIPGGRVSVDDASGEHRVAFVDGRGHFRVAGCAPGTATLKAEAPGFLPQRAEVDLPVADVPGEVVLRDLRLSLVESGTVLGVVTDRYGTPVPGAAVEGGGAKARCDGAGRFSLGPVPAGRVQVSASAPAGSCSESVDVSRGRAASLELRIQ